MASPINGLAFNFRSNLVGNAVFCRLQMMLLNISFKKSEKISN